MRWFDAAFKVLFWFFRDVDKDNNRREATSIKLKRQIDKAKKLKEFQREFRRGGKEPK